MKPLALVGLVLVLCGIAALLYRQDYTDRKPIFDAGAFHASIDREKTWSLPPAVGLVTLAAGGVLLVMGLRKRG